MTDQPVTSVVPDGRHLTDEQHLPDEHHLDGNALAGPLGEIFAVDVTTAIGRCASCGRAGPLAALMVYSDAPGLVARCPHCTGVLLRLVRGPVDVWLDLHGALSLRIAVPTG